jgi:DNA polymerase-1
VAFDPKGKLWRQRIYPRYKSNRGKRDEAFSIQRARVYEILDTMKVACFDVPTYEADDVIATLVDAARGTCVDTMIVGKDKDLHQLVAERASGGSVLCYDPIDDVWTGSQQVVDKWGFPPDMVPQVQAIIGDSTDCVPGVHGVGIKGATRLLKQYGSLDGILDNMDELSPATRKAFKGTDVPLMLKLVALDKETPLPEEQVDKLRWNSDGKRLAGDIFDALAFKGWTSW